MKRLLRKNDGDADEAKREQIARLKMRKLLFIGAAVISLFAVICWFGWASVSVWRQGRDLKKAASYEKAGDYRRALLTLEQVVQIYPLNIEAKRNLASFYERAGQRQALEIWNQATRLEPKNPQNWLGLAQCAVRFLDERTLRRALSALRELDDKSEAFYRLEAASAMLTSDEASLETNLIALAQAKPADLRVQLRLALVRIKSVDKTKSADGRATLIKLAQEDALRMRVIVELLSDVARRWPEDTPERDAELNALARAIVPAEGPRIDLVSATSVDRLVSFAQGQPNAAPEDVAVFVQWMTANGWSAYALRWLNGLDPAILASPLLKPVVAEAALQAQNWPSLRIAIVGGAWGPMPIEAFDRVLVLRRVSGQNPPLSLQEWNDIVELCHSSLPGLRMLMRLSKSWNWPQEKRQVLQTITRDFPREGWAWRELVTDALAQRDTNLLWKTYYNRSLAMPGDVGLLIETAMIGMLTDQRNAASVSVAEELVRREPNNNGAKVVQSLALWRAKRWVEAQAILDALPKAVFSEPRYALVYGLVLSEANRAKESQQMLDWASAERLLPEESLLVEQARARNATRLK